MNVIKIVVVFHGHKGTFVSS